MDASEIKKLALLARIQIDDTEAESLASEIEDILVYVKQVKDVASTNDDAPNILLGPQVNIWREDSNPTQSGIFSKELIAEFPDKKGDYLKVKKIL